MGRSLLRWLFGALVLSAVGMAHGQTLIAVDDNIRARAGDIHFEEEPGVLDNDTDGFDEPVPPTATAELRTDVSHGTLVLGLDGSFTYTPVATYIGIDTFTYRVVDGSIVSNDATVTITVSGCEGGPALFTCWEESAYLAKLAELGYGTIQEGFEDGAAWGTARSPNTASGILSNGITWQSNFSANGITTGSGPARTGLWGFYSLPHGDTSGSPTSLIRDGFTGTGSGLDTLVGAGGWIEGFVGGTLNFVITRSDTTAKTITFPDGSVGNLHKFFGVIETAGFTTFEVIEVDGKVEQQLYIFGDDFTIATTSAVDVTAPQVTLINSVADTGDGRLSEDEVTGVAITELLVSFSEAVRESGGDTDPDDVTNPANYLLLGDGGDGVFDTISCLTGVDPGDVAIPVDGVTYVSGSQSEATLSVNGGIALVSGSYRLMVCGTTSIMDWSGNALDGDGDGTGGDDFTRDFTLNEPPVASADSLTTVEGGTVSMLDSFALSVLDNDTDAESDPLTATLVAGPSHAAAFTLNPDGTFSYTHDGSEGSFDFFFYRANDNFSDSNTGTVSITITPVNDAPVADNQSVTTAEDTAAAITLSASDVDSTTLAYSVVSGPSRGVLSGAPPALSYQPAADYNGPDSFTFIANDGSADSNLATVSITVAAINDAPVANPDSYSTDEGGTIDTVLDLLPGVLANDSDPESDALTSILVIGPANAVTFILNPDGSFFYTHDGGQSTSDQFTYKANDTLLDSNTTTVTIVIGGINDAPVAVDDSVTTIEGGTVTVLDDLSLSVLDNDTDAESDPLTAILVIGPAHAASFTLNPDGTFSYTHDGSETITDQFTYKANDGLLDSNVATVSIVIAPVNDAPVADDQGVTTDEDTAKAITLTASDVDSATLTYSVVTGPTHGVLTGAPPALSYLPGADYNGPDSFTFIANDGADDSNVATVSITVTAINDAPVANPDSYSTDEGGTIDTAVDLLPDVLSNDSDAENDTLTAILVSGPANAVSFTLNSDGSFFYTHDGGQSTSDQFTYKANDTLLDSNTTTVSIAINPVVTLPSLSIDDVSMIEGHQGTVEAVFTISLSQSSSDPVEVDFVSADGSATAGSDYGAVSGRAIFRAGTITQMVTVVVNGDTEAESDETFFLNLANPLGAELGDDQGVGTIENDDPWTWFAAPGGDDFNSCLSPAAPCLTIQAAVDKASSGDSVRVAPGTYMENVWIGIDLVLIAEVAGQSVIDGGGAGTVLTVAASTAVTISGLEVVNGGVGGVSSLGTMILIDCWVHNNGDGLTGSFGGINSQAIGRIERCTISENIGSQEGGISNFGQLEVVNSTISGNTGSGVTNGGTVSLESCSVIGNGSFGLSGGGQTNLRATIIAGHSAGNCEWPVTSLGHNLEDLDTCSFDLGMGDIFGSDPLLGPLADNSGLTPTHKPIVGSPAIDTGPESVFPASDQRGFVRPVDGDLDGVATSDIGAVEVLPPDPSPLFQDGFESGSTIEWSNTSP